MFSFIAAFALLADPVVDLPAEVKGRPGEFLTVRAKTDGETVRWVMLDPGPSLLPSELLRDSKTAVVMSLRQGRFRLLAYTAKDNSPSLPAICVLVVQESDPGPDPGPGPDPKPPEPPGPAPSPLVPKLQAAYTADPAPLAAKKLQKAALSGLYQAAAEHAKKTTATATLRDLLDDLKKIGADMLVPSALVEVRKVIAYEVGQAIGVAPDSPFTPELRAKAVAVFAAISQALDQVK